MPFKMRVMGPPGQKDFVFDSCGMIYDENDQPIIDEQDRALFEYLELEAIFKQINEEQALGRSTMEEVMTLNPNRSISGIGSSNLLAGDQVKAAA